MGGPKWRAPPAVEASAPALFYSSPPRGGGGGAAADPHPFITALQETSRQETARRWQQKIAARARRSLGGAAAALHALGPPYREFPRQEFAFEWGDRWEATRNAAAAERARRAEGSSSVGAAAGPGAAATPAPAPAPGPSATPAATPGPAPAPEEVRDEEMRYFSFEEHATGRRKFVAATYAEFWARYRCAAWDERHAYELIRSGRPCNLYFDLEYGTAANPVGRCRSTRLNPC